MKPSQILAAVFETVLKVVIAVAVILIIYRGALFGYEYGYRIFAEEPMTTGEGRVVAFTVTEKMTDSVKEGENALSVGSMLEAFDIGKDMGKILEKNGLIRDRNLFAFQFVFSEFREDLKPGTYDLSTSMTADEMLELMTVGEGDEDEKR